VPQHRDRGLLAPNLASLRHRSGLSQKALAAKANVSVVTVRRLETGHRGNRKILDALATSLSEELREQITRTALTVSPTPAPVLPVRGVAAPKLMTLRRRTTLGRNELAARAGVHYTTVLRLESGGNGETATLKALAKVLSEELGEQIHWWMLTSAPNDT
jgi:transcriptional regulator with XRE-family HTH domain